MPFDTQPTLHGTLVELRPLRAQDYDDLYAVASDPLLWEQHPARDRYKPQVFRSLYEELLASKSALVILEKGTGRIIGASRYHGYDAQSSEVEIGWTFLARAFWGGRYNREVKQLMIGHALHFVRRVIFVIGTQNIRSQRAIEKLGGLRIGSRPNVHGGESFVYELTQVPL